MEDNTFWGHLEVLRWVIIRCLAVLVGVAVVAFCCKEWLFDGVVLAPLREDFATYRLLSTLAERLHWPGLAPEIGSVELININLASQFFIHMEMAGVVALIVAFPYLTVEMWLFVKPALYDNERKPAVAGAVSFTLLFFLGVAVSYYVIFPLTLNFLGNYQVSLSVANQISLNSYISTFLTLSLMLGLVFEMPIVAYFFGSIGVLTADFLRRYRRVAIVVILCLAAIITPSTDAFTMLLVTLPLWLLYEVSILVVKKVEHKAPAGE
ncbi:MAG: twin-arginine translocase subunit TatC [Bacteroidales bacterium]|nr:twin-arginine translocase subunit TatC [Bacteroidales bacterium]